MQQNGTSVGYLIAAIGALAAVIGVLGKFFMARLEKADAMVMEERKGRNDDTKAFLNQLNDLARENREAHEREMNQVLTRLEQSDRIAKQQTELQKQQTEILSELKGRSPQ
jgi:hypothetical protein